MGRRSRIYFRKSWRARSDRHGRFRREIRNRHQPFLLDRRDSRDDFRRPFHDAVLLRLKGALRARIFADALRRKNARAQRHQFRHHDGFFVRHFDVRDGEIDFDSARFRRTLSAARHRSDMDFSSEHSDFRGNRAVLHFSRRAHQRHLQRSAAIFSDRRRIFAARLARPQKCWRLERPKSANSIPATCIRGWECKARPQIVWEWNGSGS